jgi:hypothetical protein
MVKLEQHGNNKDVAVIAIKEYKENQKLDPKCLFLIRIN